MPAPTASEGHLAADSRPLVAEGIPAPVSVGANLPRPKPASKVETYTVSVRNVPVDDLLFALARDAKVNIDLHPGITGTVTINAIDQTLQQILTRMSKQIDMRWELDGPNLSVMPDSPFLRTYRVNYVNMSRDVSGTVTINTQIASTGPGTGGGGGNSSATDIKSSAKNHFWESLEKNLKDILRETDKILPDGSSETVMERSNQQSVSTSAGQPALAAAGPGATAPGNSQQQGTTVVKRTTFREAASVIVNPEAGVVVVRASSRQHEKVNEYIDSVIASTSRQVMIEATIAEVNLNDEYNQGINWQGLRTIGKGSGTEGVLTILQNADGRTLSKTDTSGDTLATSGKNFLLNYLSPGAGISGTLKLLEIFGNVKVLSSPKISVLNNQTAVLRVADNLVYFDVKADTTATANNSTTSVTTTAKTVSVGLVMSVTPQISDTSTVLLNVRPTITRQKGLGKRDPNPAIPANIENIVPEIQTREMESMLRLTDGEIAVMGGLMSDELTNETNAVPGLSKIPGIGSFFTSRQDVSKKSELVIFLKSTIIRDPSMNGDYRDFRAHLPGKDYFDSNPGPKPMQLNLGGARIQ